MSQGTDFCEYAVEYAVLRLRSCGTAAGTGICVPNVFLLRQAQTKTAAATGTHSQQKKYPLYLLYIGNHRERIGNVLRLSGSAYLGNVAS
jgi:hypothetical protein